MFRFHKTLDIITLFHKSGSPASTKVANLLKQVNANASTTATLDQASNHRVQTHIRDEPFELDIVENPPTEDQLRTMLEYVPRDEIPTIINGARDPTEALKLFSQSKDKFQRPVVVDWNNGRVVAGDKESKILKMLKAKQNE